MNKFQKLGFIDYDRVVPIISASVSWLIFAMAGSGLHLVRGFSL